MIPKVDLPEGQSGNWSIRRFIVTEEDARLGALRASFRDGRFTPAGSYTGLYRGSEVIMSDTPDEMRDHRWAVHQAKGHCLVLGLGLGMVVAAMLNKPEVTKVTVVELSPDVIALTGPTLKSRYGDRLEIIEADATTWKPKPGERFGVVWADIWDDLCGDNLKTMSTFNRRYGRKSDWHGNWGEGYCRRRVVAYR